VTEGRPSGTITVLFTDLVGSTELMARLGAEAFDSVRQAHFAALRAAIGRHGGEEVKNTGDGIMVTFGSVVDALLGAVTMQQVTDRQARTGPAPIVIRVGVSIGEVTFEDGDVFGTPVVEAARLVAAAGAGKILTTAIARALAGGRAELEFVDLGPLVLKGLPDAVPVCEVVWQPSASSVPMPALLTDIGRVFVGRTGEVERLAQLWKEAAAGERRVALLAGEPGVGKTRLAAELAGAAHAEGAAVLAGRCDEDLGVPYQPFVEALRHQLDHSPTEELPVHLGRYGGELIRLVPELADRVPTLAPPLRSDPETERYRLFDAVAAWLAAASTEQPVVFVLDDLQWAAKPTLLLLRHIVRYPEPTRLLILGTYRDTELPHDHPLVELLADLRRQSGVERLSISGWDQGAVAMYMAQMAGHDLDDGGLALARAIHTETEGNPFFVRELLRHLTETGAIVQRDGGWTTRSPVEDVGIPEGVREVVGRRLARLSGEANRALRMAAVVGPEFDLAVVQAAGSIDEEDLLGALDEATKARLVIETSAPRYRFAHALVRDTLYGELSAPRRVAAHRRVAEAIEALYPGTLDEHLPALAHHWARASAPAAETARAVDYATRAGDRALAQLAHQEAVAYYRQALELLGVAAGPPDEGKRLELLISLGEALRRAGDPAHREVLLKAVRLAGQRADPERLAQAALANCRGTFSAAATVDEERVAAIEVALDAIGDRHDPMRARLLAHLAMELVWATDLERRGALSAEALVVARRTGDPDVLGFVLTFRSLAIWHPSTIEGRLKLTTEALNIALRTQDPTLTFYALKRRADVLMEIGNLEEAEAHLQAVDRLASEGRLHPFLRSIFMHTRAAMLLAAGQVDKAEAASRQALALGQEAGQADAPLLFAVQLVNIRFEQGRFDDELAAQLAATAERLPGVPSLQAMLAVAYCELDRLDEARQAFSSLAESGLRNVPEDNMWAPTVAIASHVCARLEDADQAAILYDLLSPYGHLIVSHPLGWYGAFPHYLGVLSTTLGHYEDAQRHFSNATDIHERLPAPGSLARTRLEWGRMLLTRGQAGDVERGRELLGQALATARDLGLGNVERQAVALLH
jgi:class 3 adenylate cyclase/tetratricopeptide (TPR) repeat protein